MTSADVLLRLKATAKEAKKEVKQMGVEMKRSLEQNLQSDINVEDHGQIERTKRRLKAMERDRFPFVKPRIDEAEKKKAEAKLKSLENREEFLSNLDVDDYNIDKFDSGIDDSTKKEIKEDVEEIQDDLPDALKLDEFSKTFEPQDKEWASDLKYDSKGRLQRYGGKGMASKKEATQYRWGMNAARRTGHAKETVGGRTGRQVSGSSGRRGSTVQDTSKGFQSTTRDTSALRQIGDNKKPTGFEKTLRNVKKQTRKTADNLDISEHHMGKIKEHGGTFVKNFKKYSPNIMMWWKLVALLLPMMIALRVQAAGVAAAMYSIAGAGAAIVGLGLLGHGEAIEDSMALMERRINELKRELFQQFSPVFQEFAPISERFLSSLTSRLQPLVDTLRQLTVFEGAIFRTFEDLVHHVNNLLSWGIQWVDTFEQVGRRFMSIAFERIQRFLEFLFVTMEREQDAMIGMIDTFTHVVNIVWQVLKAVSHFGAMMNWLLGIVSSVATIFSNKWFASLLTVAGAMYMLIALTNSAIKTFLIFKGLTLADMATRIVTSLGHVGTALDMVAAKWRAAGAAAKWKWAMATLGASLAVTAGLSWATHRLTPDTDDFGGGAGGNPGGHGGYTHSPTYNTTINVEGETSKQQRWKLEDIAREVHGEEIEIDEDTSY